MRLRRTPILLAVFLALLMVPAGCGGRSDGGRASTAVVQFAFDGNADNPHLPDNYAPNTVAYTGTHDNATTRGWYQALSAPEQQTVWKYLRRSCGAASEAARALFSRCVEDARPYRAYFPPGAPDRD